MFSIYHIACGAVYLSITNIEVINRMLNILMTAKCTGNQSIVFIILHENNLDAISVDGMK